MYAILCCKAHFNNFSNGLNKSENENQISKLKFADFGLLLIFNCIPSTILLRIKYEILPTVL